MGAPGGSPPRLLRRAGRGAQLHPGRRQGQRRPAGAERGRGAARGARRRAALRAHDAPGANDRRRRGLPPAGARGARAPWTSRSPPPAATPTARPAGLVIGLSSTTGLPATPGLLRAFGERYPDVALDVRHFTFADPYAGLLTGETDVAIVRPPFAAALELHELAREPRYVTLPSGHPLADREAGRVRRDRRRAVDEPRDRPRLVRVWMCAEHRTRPARIGAVCTSLDELFEAARVGQALGLVPSPSPGRAPGRGSPSSAWPTSSRRWPRSPAARASRAPAVRNFLAVAALADGVALGALHRQLALGQLPAQDLLVELADARLGHLVDEGERVGQLPLGQARATGARAGRRARRPRPRPAPRRPAAARPSSRRAWRSPPPRRTPGGPSARSRAPPTRSTRRRT